MSYTCQEETGSGLNILDDILYKLSNYIYTDTNMYIITQLKLNVEIDKINNICIAQTLPSSFS